MRVILSFAFLICLTSMAAAQGFPWEKFKPRTLKEVTAITTKSFKADDSMFLATSLLESKMSVTFTGKSRPIPKERLGFISTWVNMLGHPKEYEKLYQREFLYKEGKDEYWLPTQEPVTKYFDKELKEGDEMTLFLIAIGAYKSGEKEIDCVLLVEEYQKPKSTS
jgi:hypothetical protein